jgi:DNA-directed RNA polymerase subunit L
LDVQRYFKKDSFDFAIETIGVFTNNEIVKKACAIMQNKLIDFKDLIEENKVSIEPSLVTMENSYDVTLKNEDYTLGKALEFYLYENFYNSKENKKLNFCAFKKFHPHDLTSCIRVAYAHAVSVNEIGADLKDACIKLQEVYVAIHGMF